MPVSKENVKSVTIRLPVSLYDDLAGEAKKNRRSLSQQIIYLLEQSSKPSIVYRNIDHIENYDTGDMYWTNELRGTDDNPD